MGNCASNQNPGRNSVQNTVCADKAFLAFGLIHVFFILSIEFDREEFERLARERAERKLQQRTNPKGNITINVNATEIFNPYDDEFE